MHVSVFINGKAGRADAQRIEDAIRRALFRCDTHLFLPDSVSELQELIVQESHKADALIVCGGDGTLNVAVQPLMADPRVTRIPPVLPLPMGTANDLASELGVSTVRLERAAHLVLETEAKAIDVIEVRADEKSVFMLTNGGLGIAAETADLANHVRQWFATRAQSQALAQPVFRAGQDLVRQAGSRIYEMLLAGQLMSGRTREWLKGWCVTIELEDGQHIETSAPFIMVNNQPGLGGKYLPAPLTSNTDGTFNVMLLDSPLLHRQARALLDIRRGRLPDERYCPRFETSAAIFRSKGKARDLTFFGDGEILHKHVREIEVRCRKRALPVFTPQGAL
ncbi:MAG TPA: diacylglycerol kinase family protein [Pseudobdellovibrionaceae bacterium]|nr:diacylglycerol kinase family protein [Pseudobdellovibrionaceae bacterium]